MASDRIEIVEYDPAWPHMFDTEQAALLNALAGCPVEAIEHFGSTAVPGLSAKPVIDILIAVPDLSQAKASFPERLAALEYVFWANNPQQDRLFFVKGMPPQGTGRTHHVHVTERIGEMWRRLVFRDYLRAHPTEAASYAVLKRELASGHADDREGYTRAKDDFIDQVMRRAYHWSESR
ncbi:MAG: GrpB family protein [Pseudomonadota bacterium]